MIDERDLATLRNSIDAIFRDDLNSSSPHDGYHILKSRYLDNHHKERLIESYTRIIPNLRKAPHVLILGASPLEGLILRRLVPNVTLHMAGSPETLVYRSANDYTFCRHVEPGTLGEIFSVAKHSLESPIPLPDGSFDCVICLEVLEHLRRDPLGALSDMSRVLKNSGTLFMSTPNINSARALRRAFEWENPMFFPSFGPPPAGIIHAHEYSVKEIQLLMASAGFTLDDISSFDHYSSESFDHDTSYRCGGDQLSALTDQADIDHFRRLFERLRRQPLRQDYLFARATRTHTPTTTPMRPIYCDF